MRKYIHGALENPQKVVGATVVFVAIALGIILTNFKPDRRPWEESFVIGSGDIPSREWARIVSLAQPNDLSYNGSLPNTDYQINLMYRLPSSSTKTSLLTKDYLLKMKAFEDKISAASQQYCWTLDWPTLNGCIPKDTCIVLSAYTLIDCVIQNQTLQDTGNAIGLADPTVGQPHIDRALAFVKSAAVIAERPWTEKLWGKNDRTVRSIFLHENLGVPGHPLEKNEEMEEYRAFLQSDVEPILKDPKSAFDTVPSSDPEELEVLYTARGLYTYAQSAMLKKDFMWVLLPLLFMMIVVLRVHTHSTVATIASMLSISFTVLLSLFAIRIAGLSIFNTLLVYHLYIVGFCLIHPLVVHGYWRASISEHGHEPQSLPSRLHFTVEAAFTPIVQSAAIGALSCGVRVFSELPPEQSGALLGGFIFAINGLLSLTFFPAVCALMDKWSTKEAPSKLDLSARLLFRWHLHVYALRAPFVFLFVLVSLLSLLGLNIVTHSNETRAKVLPPSNQLEIARKWQSESYLHPADPVKVWLVWGLQINTRSLPSTWNGKRVPKAQYLPDFATQFNLTQRNRYRKACSWVQFDLMRQRLSLEADLCVMDDVDRYIVTVLNSTVPFPYGASFTCTMTANATTAFNATETPVVDYSLLSGCTMPVNALIPFSCPLPAADFVLPSNASTVLNCMMPTFSTTARTMASWHRRTSNRIFETEYQTTMHFDSATGDIVAMALAARTTLTDSSTDYAHTQRIYEDWERLVQDLRDIDNTDALGLIQTSPQWVHLKTQDALMQSFLYFFLACAVSLVLLMALSLNYRLTFLCALALLGMVMINVVFMLMYGWSCGIIENQAIQAAVPFVATCCVLFVAAYRVSSRTNTARLRRTQEAMMYVARPVISISFLLFISSLLPVILGNLPYTRKFTLFVITNMLLNIILVTCVLPALGFTIGPEAHEGEIMSRRKAVLSQVPGVSFFFFTSSGSKTGNAITYCLLQIVDQIASVLPISVYLMIFSAAVFQMGMAHLGFVIGGLGLVVIGLFFFLEGLKFGLMPMGNTLGQFLPFKVAPWAMQLCAFCLGVLVTFAEPAIGALQAIGSLVKVEQAPYLYQVLNVWDLLLVFCVGGGVGIACTLGLVRFVRSWRLRPMIFHSLWPPMLFALPMHFLKDGMLRPNMGLAWDCGAVTTGPVTVPLVLALGLGVSQANKKAKKEAAARLAAGGGAATGDKHTEMFQDLAMPSKRGKLARILKRTKKNTEQQQHAENPPVPTEAGSGAGPSEVPLERGQSTVAPPAEGEEGGKANLDGFGVVTLASLFPVLTVEIMCLMVMMVKPADDIISAVKAQKEAGVTPPWYSVSPAVEIVLALRAVVPLVAFLFFVLKIVLRQPLPYISLVPITGQTDEAEDGDGQKATDLIAAEGGEPGAEGSFSAQEKRKGSTAGEANVGQSVWALCIALLSALGGMMIFNLGLTYGLSDMGKQVGTIVPSAFTDVPQEGLTAAYGRGLGIIISMIFAWGLGLLATLAEPALQVLGQQVEMLTNGDFSKMMLVWAVAFGVATGVAAGVMKIIFDMKLLYWLIPSYIVAVFLSMTADEALLGVAWDSAGVTTGPVTVPLVLAMGLSFARAVNSSDGFGILTLASAGPICSVLILDISQRMIRKFFPKNEEHPVHEGAASGVVSETASPMPPVVHHGGGGEHDEARLHEGGDEESDSGEDDGGNEEGDRDNV